MAFASQNQSYGMSQKEILDLAANYIENKNRANILDNQIKTNEKWQVLLPFTLIDLYYQLKEIEKNKETEDYNESLEEN